MRSDPIEDMRRRDEIRATEKAENDCALAKAAREGKNVTFIASDGCEVTVTPGGHVFHNAADWW
jgi:hypothetical protein